jgi:hypothetical protein
MTTLTYAQRNTIIESAIQTVEQGGHGSIADVIGEVWDDCKKLGCSELNVLNLFLDSKLNKIKVSVK